MENPGGRGGYISYHTAEKGVSLVYFISIPADGGQYAHRLVNVGAEVVGAPCIG